MRRTDQEVMELMKGDTTLNRARQAFSASCGQISQAALQRNHLEPIELRRLEFEAVEKIAAELNTEQWAGELPEGKT